MFDKVISKIPFVRSIKGFLNKKEGLPIYITNASDISGSSDGGLDLDINKKSGGKLSKSKAKIGSVFSKGANFGKGIFSKGSNLLGKGLNFGKGLFSKAGGLLSKINIGSILKIGKGAGKVLGWPLAVALGLYDFGKGIFDPSKITGDSKNSFNAKMGAGMSSLLSGLTLGLIDPKTIYSAGKKLLSNPIAKAGLALFMPWTLVGSVFDKTILGINIKSDESSMGKFLKDITNGKFLDAITGLYSTIKDKLSGFISNGIDSTKNFISSGWDKLKSLPRLASINMGMSDLGGSSSEYAKGLSKYTYQMGAKGSESSIDCSGLTAKVYKDLAGYDIGAGSVNQMGKLQQSGNFGATKDLSSAQKGDLLFYNKPGRDPNLRNRPSNQPTHVTLFMGKDKRGNYLQLESSGSKGVNMSKVNPEWLMGYGEPPESARARVMSGLIVNNNSTIEQRYNDTPSGNIANTLSSMMNPDYSQTNVVGTTSYINNNYKSVYTDKKLTTTNIESSLSQALLNHNRLLF